MTRNEALLMAIEAIENADYHNDLQAIAVIKDIMAQPEQEPKHVTYAGNGTAGFLEGERPTGFFIQADRRQPEQEPVAWEQFYPDMGNPKLAYLSPTESPDNACYIPPQRT